MGAVARHLGQDGGCRPGAVHPRPLERGTVVLGRALLGRAVQDAVHHPGGTVAEDVELVGERGRVGIVVAVRRLVLGVQLEGRAHGDGVGRPGGAGEGRAAEQGDHPLAMVQQIGRGRHRRKRRLRGHLELHQRRAGHLQARLIGTSGRRRKTAGEGRRRWAHRRTKATRAIVRVATHPGQFLLGSTGAGPGSIDLGLGRQEGVDGVGSEGRGRVEGGEVSTVVHRPKLVLARPTRGNGQTSGRWRRILHRRSTASHDR